MGTPGFERDPRIVSLPAAEIRRRFLEFFAERGHTIVPGASLVPAGDQTLLFTNSGMVQFKDVFTGAETRSYTRAVDYQRVLRVAGKHNDFEEVGRTPRHHTFFEMLGNWSFGDYFKREAIRWAWDFLTRDLGLPPERLAATTYTDDEVAWNIWRDEIGLPAERMAKWGNVDKGDDRNFWRMAETGPCGPCSEIHFDRGAHLSEGPHCIPDHSEHCPRWLEIWNLVFMEFDQRPEGRVPLPFTSVDTGLGLERLASVLQQVPSNYDTDLFAPIHARMRELLGHDPDAFEQERFSYQVIADHSRAATFLLADGVLPSNEGRGYVLRKLVRRAVRHGRLLGRKEPFLAQTAAVVIDVMRDAYPFLEERREEILGGLLREESQFGRTLDAGTVQLEEALIPLTSAERVVGRRPEELPEDAPTLPGEVAFRLHDTFGFPIDLTVELAAEYGVAVDRPGFEEALAQQRQRSRSGKKVELAKQAELSSLYQSILSRVGETEFLGYETTSAEGRVAAILREGIEFEELEARPDAELRTEAGAHAEVVLDRTPFYPEGGGQIGDRGELRAPDGAVLFDVEDTQKPVGGLIVHRGTLRGRLRLGEPLAAVVDDERREHTMRNHTGTHLLHRALRNVVGERARQAGSLVTPDYLRFDFPFDRGLTESERQAIEDEVRRVIREDRPVIPAWMPLQGAIDAGADAFFDEKYGETVRTVRVEGYSHELCGGTHCRATGQIGAFVVTGERSIGSGMRRIEALTGAGADRFVRDRLAALERAAELVGAQSIEVLPERLAALQEELRETRRRLRAGGGPGLPKPGELASRAEEVAPGIRLVTFAGPFDSIDAMKGLAKDVRGALGSGVVALGLDADEPQVFVTVSDDLVGRGIAAGELVRAAVAPLDGKGGGRPEMAQGRGTRRDGLAAALEAVRAALRNGRKPGA
ncbi:MAG TPA: alanine--tRNA ligase [Candidatus Limnocylindrales bacterium]|jgi:alanyl-tRNA synthetase|nr:alanine--tRNA ligase [Candidatus Limnocylindrales bacterium]